MLMLIIYYIKRIHRLLFVYDLFVYIYYVVIIYYIKRIQFTGFFVCVFLWLLSMFYTLIHCLLFICLLTKHCWLIVD